MSWFFRRRRGSGEPPGPAGIESGLHRSPGLATLCEELEKRRPKAILDLGAPSTENVEFFSRYSDNVSIQDLFRSGGGEEGARTSIFRFSALESLALPSVEDGPYDVVLVWDLLHYFEKGDRAALMGRLRELCAPRALAFILASAVAPIPATPVHFKISSRDHLIYAVPEGAAMVAAPELRTRDVEQLMRGFSPIRSFQLRNGMQEFVFAHDRPRAQAQPLAPSRPAY